MTDELTNALAKIPDLKVTSRTSAFLFKKRRDLDIRQIGEKLKVAAVIEGTVYRTGPRLRIHAQLTKVADNFALWSDRYDRAISSAADVFGMQDDIAKSIAAALRVHLTGGSASLAERCTADLEAYNLYLQGRYAWNQRTTASVTRAVRYFEQAAARDDRFARAYAGLAAAYVVLPFFAPVSSRDAWPKVKTAADRALALDPNLAEALAARAYGAFTFERDYRAAEAGFRQAIAADPRNPTAHHWFADMLGGRGALDGRLHELKVAQESIRCTGLFPWRSVKLAALGQVDEAIAELRGTIDMDDSFASGHCQLGTLYVMKGMPTEGIREIQRALQLNGDRQASFVAYLASAYAASGQLDSARALIDG